MAGNTSNIGFEKQIWDAACVLRGNIDASEYKSVVLGLIFLKYMSDRFEAKYKELVEEGDGFEEDQDEYTAENIFFVPENARWSAIAAAAHTPEIGTVIDDAMRSIEKENKRLKDIIINIIYYVYLNIVFFDIKKGRHHGMKLMQLRYFSAVCHLGGVTRAAERLHVSQPAITAAIQNLEDELGLLLLSRGGRTLVPTLDGEAFLARCDGILTEVEGLTADFQARSQRRSTLSVGVPPMVAFFLFPKIFAEFTGSCPEVHIRLTEAGSDTARDMVRAGQLDLAIIAVGETPPAALAAHPLMRMSMMYCTGYGTPMAGREKAELREIAMAPLILFTSGYYHQTLLQTRFRDAGLTPNVLFYSNQLLTIKSFVRQNLAGAFLLPQVIEPGENIIALPVDPPLPLNIAVVWRRDVFLTREIRQFIHFMRTRFE